MTDPYAKLEQPVPVTVLTRSAVGGTTVGGTTDDGIAVVRIEPTRHDHTSGVECVACAAASDVRALLFDLLHAARQGHRPMFTRVVVDASALPDPQDVIDRLTPGKLPALGLRDHAVLRNFRLLEVL